MVRMPQPENSASPIRCRTQRAALSRVGDAAPQQVADVRGQRVDLALLAVERQREEAALGDPEVVVEAPLELRGLALELRRPSRRRPRPRAPAGRCGAWRRRRSPASRRWRAGSGPACRRRTRSSPRSPSSTGSPARSPCCGARTRCSRRRRGRRSDRSRSIGGAGLALQRARQRPVAGPALVLLEQDQEQRRRVGAAVVGRVGPLLERRHLAEPQLVQDLARLLVAERIVEPGPGTAPASAAWSPPARARTAAPGSW